MFALPRMPIKKFAELSADERNLFLNYEISVRYLKNVNSTQVKEIFQRINKTDYSLNAVERLNAQWGESEFVCFAKQIVDAEFDLDDTVFVVPSAIKRKLSKFFHGDTDDDEGVFTDNDKSRMLAYQYIMTLVATIDAGEYFHRNEKLPNYIELYNDGYANAGDIFARLVAAVDFLSALKLNRNSRWYKKANLFTLIVEADKVVLTLINKKAFAEKLKKLDENSILAEIGLTNEKNKLNPDEEKYLGFAREAVNQRSARVYRGEFIQNLLLGSGK